MKSARFFSLAFLILIFAFSTFSYAGVPQMINYQGKITTPTGALVDTTVQMTFTIYDDSTTGNVLWADTLGSVAVQKGIFSALLGSMNPIPDSVFPGDVRYLGVKVGADPEMTPRKAMVSVGYAYKSEYSDTAQYAHVAVSDGDWFFRITDTADTTLMTGGEWGIARSGNTLYGNADSTHVNLGVACTTGTSGQDYKYSTVAGGYGNTASNDVATVAGGYENTASGHVSTIGGGADNTAVGEYSTIGGGYSNTASQYFAAVGGGANNTASHSSAAVGGGYYNTASGYSATVPGGFADTAAGDFSLAAGDSVRITSDGDYTFAFGRNFTTSTPNAVIFHNSVDPIKVGIGTATPQARLHVVGHTQIDADNFYLCGHSPAGTNSPTISLMETGSPSYWAIIKRGSQYTNPDQLIFSYNDGSDWHEALHLYTNKNAYFWGSVGMDKDAYFHGKVGIGTSTPNAASKLHVQHDNLYAGYFTSNYMSDTTHVIHSEFTGSGTRVATAVYGKSNPADHNGFGGWFEGGYMGVRGHVFPTGSGSYYGVWGSVSGGAGNNFALRGTANGSGINYGVYGNASDGTTNWAGYFTGNAKVTGTLSKGGGSFQIDHPLDPENKYLLHSFVESPDMMNVYNGNVILDANGEATVELPAYFEALNKDFRYQLTAIGAPGPNLYISQEISGNSFKIAGGEQGMKVSWQVTGIRHDKFAEANRIQVEVDKPDNERGKYLHPEAYNLSEEYDIHYEQHKRMKEHLEKE